MIRIAVFLVADWCVPGGEIINYELIEKKGLKMLSILPINNTGIAEAYCTVRNNARGHSKGRCGPFSCNLYKNIGLKEGQEDFKLFCQAINVDYRKVVTNRLTAFTNIVRIITIDDLKDFDIFDEPNIPRADGLITNQSDGLTLMNYGADCQIILFLDPTKRVIGSLHASWKGSLIGIIHNQIKSFVYDYNSNTTDIIAVLMPCISKAYYGITQDRVELFEKAGFSRFIDYTSYDCPHVDLTSINKHILIHQGLDTNKIYTIDDLCTYKDGDLFHSYRKGPIDKNGVHLNGINGYFIKLL